MVKSVEQQVFLICGFAAVLGDLSSLLVVIFNLGFNLGFCILTFKYHLQLIKQAPSISWYIQATVVQPEGPPPVCDAPTILQIRP